MLLTGRQTEKPDRKHQEVSSGFLILTKQTHNLTNRTRRKTKVIKKELQNKLKLYTLTQTYNPFNEARWWKHHDVRLLPDSRSWKVCKAGRKTKGSILFGGG